MPDQQNNSSPKTRKTSEATISLAVLVLVTFFTALYMKGLNSGIPLYYDSIGYSATLAGSFVAVFTLASTAMRLVGGQITDHFAHYKVLLVSLAGLFLGVVLPVLSDAFALVMVSRVIQGASFALATNVMTVAVMGSASKKHLGKRVGIKGAGTSLGTMLGALISTFLLDNAGYEAFYLFYAALMVVAIGAIVALKHGEDKRAKAAGANANAAPAASADSSEEHLATTKQLKAAKQTKLSDHSTVAISKHSFKQRARAFIAPYLFPQVAPYLAISFARRVPKGFCIAFVLVFARYAGIGMGAAFFIAAGATTLCCRLFGGKLFDSNKTWLLFPLLSVQVIGFALLALKPSFATLIIAAICYGISVGTSSPFIKTLTAKSTPKEHWGVVNGEVYFFGDLGKACGAFFGGLILDITAKSCMPEVALGFALFTSVVCGVALLVGRHIKPRSVAKL